MIKKVLLSAIFFACTFVSKYTFGQAAANDTTLQKVALANIADAYNQGIGQQSRLFNGPEYDLYNPIIKGNACFADVSTFTPGTVTYDGIFYKEVPMLYDLYKDVVGVLLYNKFSRFTLLNERLESFDLLGHHFIYLKADSLNATSPGAGIYDQLYKGNLEVLVKRSKSIQNSASTTTIESFFLPKVNYYLKKGDSYYGIGGQSTLLKILKDKKKELQQYIKVNKIKFKKTPEEALGAIAARYDELSR